MKNKIGLGFSIGVCVVTFTLGLQVPPASAQNANKPTLVSAAPQKQSSTKIKTASAAAAAAATPAESAGKGYYIEFRARNAASYGHAFVLYGPVGGKGTIAGLHPAGDTKKCVNCSAGAWTIGHLIFVPSETGKSDGDDEKQYLLANYRVTLNAAEYKNVVTYIKKLQASSPVWHAVLYNCNAFVRDIAQHMGLEAPGVWNQPKDFVNGIRDKNKGKKLAFAADR